MKYFSIESYTSAEFYANYIIVNIWFAEDIICLTVYYLYLYKDIAYDLHNISMGV